MTDYKTYWTAGKYLLCFLFFSVLFACKAESTNIMVFRDKSVNIYMDISQREIKQYELITALDDFYNYFEKITGHSISKIKNSSVIPIKLTKMGKYGGNFLDAKRHQGFKINVSNKEINIKAYTNLGFRNALYHVLEHWGCRWIMFGKIGEVIPKKNILTLPKGEFISPDCYDTSVQGILASFIKGNKIVGPEVLVWWKRNQAGQEYNINGRHNWIGAIPAEKHFKQHPEWYSLIANKRVPLQLCTTNPELIGQMVEEAKKYLRASPARMSFPLDPEDNADFCQCATCKKLDLAGYGDDGNLLATNRVVHFANAVAKGIRDEFPDRYIAFYAYATHLDVPVGVELEKNICVILCRSNHCMLHLTPNPQCPSSMDFYKLILEWKKFTNNLYVYEYDPMPWTAGLPCPIYLDHAEAYSAMFKYGIKGGYTDNIPYFIANYAGTFLNQYIERRIKINPKLSGKTILKDMCEHFFGPASQELFDYYIELAKSTSYTHPNAKVMSLGLYDYWKIFNPDVVAKAKQILNKALKKATVEPYKSRVNYVALSQNYLEAYIDGCRNADLKNFASSQKGFEQAMKIIDAMSKVNMINFSDAQGFMSSNRNKAFAINFPEKFGFITNWKVCGPFDNIKRSADYDPTPPPALDGMPAVDGVNYQWEDYKSPSGGFLNLSEFVAGKKITWKLSWMYAGIKLIVPKDCVVNILCDGFYPFVVFVNGKKVFHKTGLTVENPGRFIKAISLKKGSNDVVFRLSQTNLTDPWGIYLQIEKPNGELLLNNLSSTNIKLNTLESPKNWAIENPRPRVADARLECGFKFSVQKDGEISAFRFYQAQGEDGAHVLNLWDNAGKLIQKIPVPEEKKYGWIETKLPQSLQVKSGDIFTISYANNKKYPFIKDFFTKPIVRDGITGLNGVYSLELGNFPNKVYYDMNYFLDVVYKPNLRCNKINHTKRFEKR